MTDHRQDSDTSLITLHNGVRVLAIDMPHLETASVSVFVRSGSQHESRSLNGISHLVEHMAFKGTLTRDCQQINLDAERLGAEVNAHTDKDHTAYHMRGLARDAERFVQMLGDIVQNGTYPEAELERERQVILQEYMEDEDDALSTAYKLFDKTCFGSHAVAQPIIGTRANIERFTREDLVGYVQRQYTAANVVVGVAGPVAAEQMARAAEAAFGAMPTGTPHRVAPPEYRGGIRASRLPGYSQSHVVLGFPTPALHDPRHHASVLAAALFGEGMSSPLLDQVRERLGLVYHAACSADVMELCGQFVIEASTVPEHLESLLVTVMRLLREHADATDPVGLERARNQIVVRQLQNQERSFGRLEAAAQDVFVYGRVRPRAELRACLQEVTPAQVRDAFAQMLACPLALAIAGKVSLATKDRVRALVAEAGGTPLPSDAA